MRGNTNGKLFDTSLLPWVGGMERSIECSKEGNIGRGDSGGER